MAYEHLTSNCRRRGFIRRGFGFVRPGGPHPSLQDNHEFVVTQPGTLDNLGPIHIACVYDPAKSYMGLYTNGVLAASRADLGSFYSLTNVWNVHSWLGQSLYSADAFYNGTLDEFRIYNAPLDALQIAGSYVAGPDTVGTDPGAVSALNLTVKTPLVSGATGTVAATADFAKIKGVNLADVSGVTFSSSDTNILTVTAGELCETRSGASV